MPQLCLYTGARASEIAQPRLADIATIDGISCITIRVTQKEQRVKNKPSVRVIPLAQPLIDAGFLIYVEEVRATKHPRLFPISMPAISFMRVKPSTWVMVTKLSGTSVSALNKWGLIKASAPMLSAIPFQQI